MPADDRADSSAASGSAGRLARGTATTRTLAGAPRIDLKTRTGRRKTTSGSRSASIELWPMAPSVGNADWQRVSIGAPEVFGPPWEPAAPRVPSFRGLTYRGEKLLTARVMVAGGESSTHPRGAAWRASSPTELLAVERRLLPDRGYRGVSPGCSRTALRPESTGEASVCGPGAPPAIVPPKRWIQVRLLAGALRKHPANRWRAAVGCVWMRGPRQRQVSPGTDQTAPLLLE